MADENFTSATGSTRSKVRTKPHHKTKSLSLANAIQLSPAMIDHHAQEKAIKELHAFMDNISDAEMRVVGHVKPYDFGFNSKRLMDEFSRLLGESSSKCKVIPFQKSSKNTVKCQPPQAKA